MIGLLFILFFIFYFIFGLLFHFISLCSIPYFWPFFFLPAATLLDDACLDIRRSESIEKNIRENRRETARRKKGEEKERKQYEAGNTSSSRPWMFDSSTLFPPISSSTPDSHTIASPLSQILSSYPLSECDT